MKTKISRALLNAAAVATIAAVVAACGSTNPQPNSQKEAKKSDIDPNERRSLR
jgi:hypothetical protein